MRISCLTWKGTRSLPMTVTLAAWSINAAATSIPIKDVPMTTTCFLTNQSYHPSLSTNQRSPGRLSVDDVGVSNGPEVGDSRQVLPLHSQPPGHAASADKELGELQDTPIVIQRQSLLLGINCSHSRAPADLYLCLQRGQSKTLITILLNALPTFSYHAGFRSIIASCFTPRFLLSFGLS